MRFDEPAPEHAEPIALHLAVSFQGYKAFAPAGWEPPDVLTPHEVERIRREISDPRCFALIAVHGDDPVGHVLWVPDESEPGGAYLRQLFVLEPWWGTEVARELHDRSLAVMRERGWPRGRLLTPAGQARARRFYERHGWSGGDPVDDDRLGIPVCEYRRPL